LEIQKDTGSGTEGVLLRLNSVNGNYGNGGSILWTNNSDTNLMAKIYGIDANGWGGDLIFATKAQTGSSAGSPTERMRIDYAGNVGIGVAPSYTLDVNGEIHGNYHINLTAYPGYGSGTGSFYYSGNANSSAGAFVYNNGLDVLSGNVGIGTTSPASKLSVGGAGNSAYAIYGYISDGYGVYGQSGSFGVYGNSTSGGYGVSGIASGYGTGVYGQSASGSDFRGSWGESTIGAAWTNGSSRVLKENFTNLDSQAILGKILQLPITEWNYISLPGSNFIGPMAEDFYASFGLGNSSGIDTISPAAIALVGIKALNENLNNQQVEIASLSASLGSIDSRITIDNSGNVGQGVTVLRKQPLSAKRLKTL